jgi:hypothetical protein
MQRLADSQLRYADVGITCQHCGSGLIRDFITPPVVRQVSRVSAPSRPRPPLPTWRWTSCGCIQPRIE